MRRAIKEAAKGDPRARIFEVRKDPGWAFHQAHVRRSGFRAVTNDRILTGDIDIRVNRNCLKAVDLVGTENIGLVSLSKRRGRGTKASLLRNAGTKLVRTLTNSARFTGLYALYRPYWLDSEVEEEVRRSPYPLSPGLLGGDQPFRGEDAILRDYMRLKHKVVLLQEVGGEDLREAQGDRPPFQMKMGKKMLLEGRPLDYVLIRSMLYSRGTMLGTYLHFLAKERGSAGVMVQILKGMTGPVKMGWLILLRSPPEDAMRRRSFAV